jgi:hypothetical protein
MKDNRSLAIPFINSDLSSCPSDVPLMLPETLVSPLFASCSILHRGVDLTQDQKGLSLK